MSIDLKALIAKLDRDTKKVLEQAATVCVSQTHFDVEPEHLLFAMVKSRDAAVKCLLERYDLTLETVERELEASLAKLKRGNSRTPAMSPRVPDMLEQALLTSVAVLDRPTAALPALLIAPLQEDPLRGLVIDCAPSLESINVDDALKLLPELMIGQLGPKPRPLGGGGAAAAAANAAGGPAQLSGGQSSLDLYTVDLTALAKADKLDPVTGRDGEIRQLVDVMMRRRQNNPILVGEPGVGKTAVVEGLAQRIAAGDVPPPLQSMSVRTLDLGLLQAGAGVKGEFEERLKGLIKEVAAQPNPVVIFIDEAHTMIGAGGAAGQNDAANLLKPALARGDFRTIAATTWSEYKRYFEKDPALARRFQPITVAEPAEDPACGMLRGLVGKLEAHHGVRILDEAITSAVKLSARYLPARQLPDKAISVLDTACARVAIGRSVLPEEIEAIDRELQGLAVESAILERQPGGGGEARLDAIAARHEEAGAERLALVERWEAQKAVVERLETAVRGGANAADVAGLRKELESLQGEGVLVPWCVDAAIVADVISEWTGIPVGSLSEDEAEVVRKLDTRLSERIVGQPQASMAIARAIRAYHAGLAEPGRPVGVFLLCGPSGVGKTETAYALAQLLYGGDASLISVNMSEYQEAHSVATLRGSPPGYVGFGQGGVLTEAVRRRPYSVVLLDEVEKAHPDVLDMFYQVFDKGKLEDGEGVEVDFRNTVILLTSNVADEELSALAGQMRSHGADPDGLLEMASDVVAPVLRHRFRPSFLGRLTVVPYMPLAEDDVRCIVDMRCDRVAARFSDQQGHALTFSDAARDEIVRRAQVSDTGARIIENVLNATVIPQLAGMVLDSLSSGEPIGAISVDAEEDGRLVCRRTAA